MRSSLLRVMLVASLASSASADEPASPGISWQGSVAIGAELDEQGLPNDEQAPEKPSRFRLGFVAKWSFSLRWEQIDSAADEPSDIAELSADETKLFELTNAERKKQKLAPLKLDAELLKLARAHAATMARLDQIGHDLEGKTFAKRMDAAKYAASRAGENVAAGQRNPAETVRDWMQSPGHKANILQTDYTHFGLGLATSKSGKTYWTQIFAKPMSVERK